MCIVRIDIDDISTFANEAGEERRESRVTPLKIDNGESTVSFCYKIMGQ